MVCSRGYVVFLVFASFGFVNAWSPARIHGRPDWAFRTIPCKSGNICLFSNKKQLVMVSPLLAGAAKTVFRTASSAFSAPPSFNPVFPGLSSVVQETSKTLDTVLKSTKQALIPATLQTPDQTSNWLRLELMPWLVTILAITIPSALMNNFDVVIVWLCAELAFLVLCAIKYLAMNEISSHSLSEPVHFQKLWHECFSSLSNGKEWLSGWFFNAEFDRITREDVVSWLSWAIFGVSDNHLNNRDRVKVLRLVSLLQARLQHTFPRRKQGQTPLKSMRFSIEPMQFFPKPLLFYSICSALGAAGDVQLQRLGFRRHTAGELTYMVRMPPTAEGRARVPIVFVHGVGIGLVTYLKLLKELAAWDTPIIAVELPYVSMQLGSAPPSIEAHVESVCGALDSLGLDKAHLIGHSYGSLLLSWMIKHAPSRVAGAAFVDPVTFMLHLPNVLRSFLYSKGAPGFRVSDLVGSELYLNHALRRHFVWCRNILFCSEVEAAGVPTIVALSEDDEIVPSREVARHIRQHRRRAAGGAGAAEVELYVMPDASHGQVLFDQALHDGLARRIRRHWAATAAATGAPAAKAPAPTVKVMRGVPLNAQRVRRRRVAGAAEAGPAAGSPVPVRVVI